MVFHGTLGTSPQSYQVKIPQLHEISRRFFEAHLAFAELTIVESIRHFDQPTRPRPDEQLEQNLETAGLDHDAARDIPTDEEETRCGVSDRRQRPCKHAGG